MSLLTFVKTAGFLHLFRQGQVHFLGMKIFLQGGLTGTAPPSENLGHPPILETIIHVARKSKFYIHSDGSSTLSGYENFSARGF